MTLRQSIDQAQPDNFATVLARTSEALTWLRAHHADGTLPLLRLPEKRDDIAAILGYLRSRPPAGAETPPPTFGSAARREIVQGALQPMAPLVLVQMPAIDLGPHYDGGRYIAMMACGSCHATELIGSTDGRVPDLNVTTHHSREQFLDLMRRGVNARGHWLPTMGPLARKRFHILKDWEIDPLYAYLVARAKAPTIDQISNSIR